MNIMRFGRRVHDWLWDVRLNISTRQEAWRAGDISVYKDSVECVPTGYFLLQTVFKKISIRQTDVFADYGCGTGRVVCFAARFPFRKVYGIELYADLGEIAKHNAGRLRRRKACIEIVGGRDALDFDCTDVTCFFFFNPFGKATMRGVLKRIRASLSDNPRHVQMIYFNPKQADVFAQCDWLTRRAASVSTIWGGHEVLFYEDILVNGGSK